MLNTATRCDIHHWMSQNDIFCRYVTGINHIKFKTCPTHKDFTDQGIKQSVMSHLYNEKHVFSKA